MAAQFPPETVILYDSGYDALVKVVGYFTGACTANAVVCNTKALFGANVSQTCIVSVSEVQFDVKIPGGYVAPYFEGSTNVAIAALSGGAGTLQGVVNNTAPAPTGNIGVQVAGTVAAGDCFTLYLKLRKQQFQGFANVDAGYAP